jgi:hypothetical protein
VLAIGTQRGPKVGSGILDLDASCPRDPRAPPGVGTPLGVWGSGWAPGSRTRKPLDLVALMQGLGPGTQIRLRGLPLALEAALVLAALRPTPYS